MHAYYTIREKLRHQLRHPGRVLHLKIKDLIGHLWVSLIIDQSECLVYDLFLLWINSFSLHCFKECNALNQSEWRNFCMYIIRYQIWVFHPPAHAVSPGSFSNDDGNGKENVTWKKTPSKSWLFSIVPSCLQSILLAKYATSGLVCATLN